MTTKYVARGDTVNYTCTGAVTAGDLIVMSHIVGVALTSGVNGDVIAVAIEGVFTVPKLSAAVFVVGEKLVLDVSATPDCFDDSAMTPATGDITGAAIAMVAGLNGETTCVVKLTPGNATIT